MIPITVMYLDDRLVSLEAFRQEIFSLVRGRPMAREGTSMQSCRRIWRTRSTPTRPPPNAREPRRSCRCPYVHLGEVPARAVGVRPGTNLCIAPRANKGTSIAVLQAHFGERAEPRSTAAGLRKCGAMVLARMQRRWHSMLAGDSNKDASSDRRGERPTPSRPKCALTSVASQQGRQPALKGSQYYSQAFGDRAASRSESDGVPRPGRQGILFI